MTYFGELMDSILFCVSSSSKQGQIAANTCLLELISKALNNYDSHLSRTFWISSKGLILAGLRPFSIGALKRIYSILYSYFSVFQQQMRVKTSIKIGRISANISLLELIQNVLES